MLTRLPPQREDPPPPSQYSSQQETKQAAAHPSCPASCRTSRGRSRRCCSCWRRTWRAARRSAALPSSAASPPAAAAAAPRTPAASRTCGRGRGAAAWMSQRTQHALSVAARMSERAHTSHPERECACVRCARGKNSPARPSSVSVRVWCKCVCLCVRRACGKTITKFVSRPPHFTQNPGRFPNLQRKPEAAAFAVAGMSQRTQQALATDLSFLSCCSDSVRCCQVTTSSMSSQQRLSCN